ncbi:MAG TPA: L-threonylcarbamoyladenylate synthase [Nitrosomonas sp.]|nr:L-threonylcarbamoyladenylate synthase [Nitrosomonas sp.]
MAKKLVIHPENPQLRLIQQAVKIIQEGGVIIYPTDSAYALGCHLGDKAASERIRRIRQLDKHHHFTLVCCDLSQLSSYARVDNPVFRLLKSHTPGPYTFILEATKEVPRRLIHPRRRTIGLRVPDHPIAQALLSALGEPLMSVTLILPGQIYPLTDREEITKAFHHQVDLIIDGGACSMEPTSVIDLTQGAPQVVRAGKGNVKYFMPEE